MKMPEVPPFHPPCYSNVASQALRSLGTFRSNVGRDTEERSLLAPRDKT